jgi:uncharacterized protein (DUF2249 family)
MSIVIDARDLEPPEPFERVMEALCDMQPGDDVVLILTREPFPLYRVLERNGYAWQATGFDDGRFEIRIWDKTKPPGQS